MLYVIFLSPMHRNSATLLNQLVPDKIIKNPLISYKLVKRHGKELQVFDQAIQTFVSELQGMHFPRNLIKYYFEVYPV